MKKNYLLSALFLSSLVLTGCSNSNTSNSSNSSNSSGSTTNYNNDTTPFVMSSAEVDGVFNPFYSTNVADSNVISLTQIGMLTNDKQGNIAYGENEATVVLDYAQESNNGVEDVDLKTTYYFVLKNDILFSNGSPLTMKDVLFNLYTYLDPVYSGSSTIYSTDIVGLSEYRTGKEGKDEQDRFESQFQIEATARIDDLKAALQEIDDEHDESLTSDQIYSYLASKSSSGVYEHVAEDFQKLLSLFKEMLETDFTNAKGSATDYSFKNEDGGTLKNVFTTDVEAFLYSEGYIQFNKKGQGSFTCDLASDYKEVRSWTSEQAINAVYNHKMSDPTGVSEVIDYWSAGSDLDTYLVNQAKSKYFEDLKNSGKRQFPNISGIKFVNKDEAVTVNGKTYEACGTHYNADGSVNKDYNEVLSITINNVDPKAIWNFSFGVAPMYYYSDAEHIKAFDYESNFGVEYGNSEFYENVVNSPDKVGVPVGAGPYVAANSNGGTENVTSGSFRNNNVIYYERNDKFLLGKPLIKYLRYQIVPTSRMVDVLTTGAVDFTQPNCKPEIVRQLNNLSSQGIGSTSIETAGYGFIGINAAKVPSVNVRRAIMHAIDIQETVTYYGDSASPVYRSMSRSSWAYPKEAGLYYDYDSTGKTSEDLVIDAGYTKGGDGIYQLNGDKLEYTFTIAGAETDHPAYNALLHASEILNEHGFKITVTNDSNALSKLSIGALTVWAAAWGSTIDPDMYQVYHWDSKATSTLNWGYNAIRKNAGGKYDFEENLIKNELSPKIDAARKTLNENTRKSIYSECLDLVMDLAVELPTYQRDDLFAYNKNKLDESTFTKESDRSSYNGLLSKIWEVGYVGNNNDFSNRK